MLGHIGFPIEAHWIGSIILDPEHRKASLTVKTSACDSHEIEQRPLICRTSNM